MQVGRAFGVRIRLDKFFLLLLLVYSFLGLLPQVLAIFGTVFIHELAHVLVARSYGYRVKEIELLPFGGVARIEELDLVSLKPEVETNIALAGPLQNLFLAGVGLGLRYFFVWQEPLASFFIYCNLGMAVINLLPALPLDGGRIARAYLVRQMGYREATERITRLGRYLGVILGATSIVGIYYSWVSFSFFFVALFVYLAAGREKTLAAYVFMRFLTRKQLELQETGILPVEALMATEATTVREVVRRFAPKRFHLVLLSDGKTGIGDVLTEAEIVNGLLEKGLDTPLGDLQK